MNAVERITYYTDSIPVDGEAGWAPSKRHDCTPPHGQSRTAREASLAW